MVAALARIERCAGQLRELRDTHRSATLSAVGEGRLTTAIAITRVDTVRELEQLVYHLWRCTRYLAGSPDVTGQTHLSESEGV
jgi:hypothetical protein